MKTFKSKYIGERNIDIWVPSDYSTAKKYEVLYMHDGQMLYDSTTTWNKQAWDIDDVASALMKEGKLRDFIVVGIWNGGKTRHSDYFPQKPFESLSEKQQELISRQLQDAGKITAPFYPDSDNYLKFLVYEVKPFVDQNFSVFPEKSCTFVAGSSMGGLISLYAICEYPDIFEGAACLSTHWPGTYSVQNNPIPGAFFNFMNNSLPDPETHRIYFDYGDQTLDALYPPLQKEADEIMKKKGFSAKNWETLFFPGDDHSEKSWNKRLHFPLEFLLGKNG